MATTRKRLGELLIERGKLDTGSLERALRLQQETPERLGSLLVTLGLVAPRDVAEALAAQLDLPLLDAAGYPELPILEERVSPRFLRDARALPVREDADELVLAMADPTDGYAIDAFSMVTGRRVRPMVAVPGDLDAALERLYGSGKSAMGQIVGDDVEMRGDEIAFDADGQQLKDLASEAPVIRLVSLLITNALEARASDIHIEPFENRLTVRYRIDGVLHEVETRRSISLPCTRSRMRPSCGSRFSAMSSRDITLMRETISGATARFVCSTSRSTPSTRNRITSRFSNGSMWMSEAFSFTDCVSSALISRITGASSSLSSRSEGSGMSCARSLRSVSSSRPPIASIAALEPPS